MDEIVWAADPTNPKSWRRLSPEDSLVWSAFLDRWPNEVTRAAFDVPIGPGLAAPLGASDAEQRMYAGLSRQRMDVVFEWRGRLFSAEVKPRIGLEALGQAFFGTVLLYDSYPAMQMAEPAVICYDLQAGLMPLLSEHGIVLHQVDPSDEVAEIRKWL